MINGQLAMDSSLLSLLNLSIFELTRLLVLPLFYLNFQLPTLHGQLLLRGEYRSRTDDLLNANQAL
jgi:hypothetical protein